MASTLEEMSLSDRKRFALCFLSISNKADVDWAAAAAAYDPNVKEASFKTVTSKATKKYTNDLSELPEADINRFALCFVHCNQHAAVDWSVASKAYSSTVKEASFKTVTMKALKKLGNTTADDGTATTVRGKKGAVKKSSAKTSAVGKAPGKETTATKKRKTGHNCDDGDDDDDRDYGKVAAKAKKPRKSLKSLQPTVKSEEEEEHSEIVGEHEDNYSDGALAAFVEDLQENEREADT